MNAYLYFVGSMHIYRLLIMSGHVMGWTLVWAVGGCGPQPRSLSSIIMGPMSLTRNVLNLSSFCLVSQSCRPRPVTLYPPRPVTLLEAQVIVALLATQAGQFYLLSENNKDMSNTSATLLWSAISSVDFLPVDTCRLCISPCDRF